MPPKYVPAMPRVGHVFQNKQTKERAILLTDPAVRPDKAMVGHLHVGAGGRVAAPHLHPQATERFHVISGRIGFVADGQTTELGPGQSAEVLPGIVHDWWQIGEEPANVIVDLQPGDRFVEMLSTMFGLVRDGKVGANGMPDLLQLAVTAHEYRDTMVFAKPPRLLQRLVFGALAPIGRLTGRQSAYQEYFTSSEVESPSLSALQLLDQHGRLHWTE
jgi:quercetin dioxygenase-like cupin family protein